MNTRKIGVHQKKNKEMEKNVSLQIEEENKEKYEYNDIIQQFLQNKQSFRLIGNGWNRNVYDIPNHKQYVLKEQKEMKKTFINRYANLQEYLFWQIIQDDSRFNHLFPPSLFLSPCMKYLICKKAEPCNFSQEDLKTITNNFIRLGLKDVIRVSGDKYSNIKIYQNNPCMVDYEYNVIKDLIDKYNIQLPNTYLII